MKLTASLGLGKLVAYPFYAVRNRMILSVGHKTVRYSGFVGCFVSTFKQEGIKGFYRGFQVELLVIAASFIMNRIVIGKLANPGSSA